MNVLFHTTTAIGVAVILTDTKRIGQSNTSMTIVLTGILAFFVGVISHGALDYIPHCYPINSKIDVIAGLFMICVVTWLTNKKYRIIMGLSFLGSVFPDIIDLFPEIVSSQLGITIPKTDKVFPWHFHDYSGSIFTGNCTNSNLNHTLLMLTLSIICWSRRADFKMIFKNK